jgi:hypothetical protein
VRVLILISIFTILFISLLANPAPVSIEKEDLLLIGLPFLLAVVCICTKIHYPIYLPERNLLIAIMIYLSYLIISILMAIIEGIPILNILRSIGPYINFFPLLLIGMLPSRILTPSLLAFIFILVGICQAIYQIKLYYIHSYAVTNTLEVLRNRITLIEPRTTLPLVLSVTILPLTFLSHKKLAVKLFGMALVSLGVIAGAATLTRSVIISIMIGWLAFLILYLYVQAHQKRLSLLVIFRKFSSYLMIGIATICIISFVPKINTLEHGLIARFCYSSSSGASVDYSNGRLYDEWLPALNLWIHSGITRVFFGIGAGNTFTVVTGEERTYIHNLLIYTLVYGGLYGLFAILWLYFTVFKIFLLRAFQAHSAVYVGFAALLVTLFSYGQFFAVHKGLAYNAMFFLMIMLALSQPVKQH